MTDEPKPSSTVSRRTLLAGGAAAAIGIGAVYGIVGAPGNSSQIAACGDATETGSRIAALARGQMAGFAVASSPIKVSDLAFKDGDGADMTMADFAGSTILLNLWATWCAPCRHEMPALDRLQAKLGGNRFNVVAVNIDTGGTARPRRFLKEIAAENLGFYADDTMGVFNTLKRRGRAIGMPTTLLIDPQGCEIGTLAGPAEWDSDDAVALIEAATVSG
ncbi:MAG: TlpA disulfide reductase family protein [Pseudomonadota bacterium]